MQPDPASATMAHVTNGAAAATARPVGDRVSIVVSLREGHGLAVPAYDQLLAHTSPDIRIVYLDIGSPPRVRAALEQRAGHRPGVEFVRFPFPTWPSEARAAILDRLTTEYVIFIDNDVAVAPGWLEWLLQCADETGAALVGPLYLEGGGAEPMTVHMAGGDLVRRETTAGPAIDESHRLMHAPLAEARECTRQPCDFVEFHCLLARRAIFSQGVSLHRGVGCVHEHIDLSMQVAALGLPIVIEPRSRVLQMRDGDYLLSDVPLLRWRWDAAAVDESIAEFCRLWSVVPDEQSFRGVNIFAADRRRHNDPIRRGLALGPTPPDFATTPRTTDTLLNQLETAGYEEDESWTIRKACNLASDLHRDTVGPDGRPFVEYPIRVAACLAQHRFHAPILVAALLHAAYTNGRSPSGTPSDLDGIADRIVANCGATAERTVRDATRLLVEPRGWIARHQDIAMLRLSSVAPIVIAAAATIVLPSSGIEWDEFASPGPDTEWDALLRSVLNAIECESFYATYRTVAGPAGSPWDRLAELRHRAWHGYGCERAPADNQWVTSWLRRPNVYAGRVAGPAPAASPRRTGTR